jgi:hypothetical protein
MAPTATPICHLFNIAFPPLLKLELPVFRHFSAGGGVRMFDPVRPSLGSEA